MKVRSIVFVLILVILTLPNIVVPTVDATSPMKYTFDDVFVEVIEIFYSDNLSLKSYHKYYTFRIWGNYEENGKRVQFGDEIIGFDNMGSFPEDVKVGDFARVTMMAIWEVPPPSGTWAIHEYKGTTNPYHVVIGTFLIPSIVLFVCIRKKTILFNKISQKTTEHQQKKFAVLFAFFYLLFVMWIYTISGIPIFIVNVLTVPSLFLVVCGYIFLKR